MGISDYSLQNYRLPKTELVLQRIYVSNNPLPALTKKKKERNDEFLKFKTWYGKLL